MDERNNFTKEYPMNARCNKNSISISGIMNESLLERLNDIVEQTGVTATYSAFGTKCKITGTPDQLNAFVNAWNSNR